MLQEESAPCGNPSTAPPPRQPRLREPVPSKTGARPSRLVIAGTTRRWPTWISPRPVIWQSRSRRRPSAPTTAAGLCALERNRSQREYAACTGKFIFRGRREIEITESTVLSDSTEQATARKMSRNDLASSSSQGTDPHPKSPFGLKTHG